MEKKAKIGTKNVTPPMLTLMIAEIIIIFFFAYQTVYKKFLVLYRFYEFSFFYVLSLFPSGLLSAD